MAEVIGIVGALAAILQICKYSKSTIKDLIRISNDATQIPNLLILWNDRVQLLDRRLIGCENDSDVSDLSMHRVILLCRKDIEILLTYIDSLQIPSETKTTRKLYYLCKILYKRRMINEKLLTVSALVNEFERCLFSIQKQSLASSDTLCQVFNVDDPASLVYINERGIELQQSNRLTCAEEAHRFCLQSRARILGHEDLQTLRSKMNLAITLHYQKKFSEAETYLLAATQALKSKFGPECLDTLMAHLNLTRFLRDLARYEEAEVLAIQWLSGLQKHHGAGDRITLFAIQDLVIILQGQEKFVEALSWAVKAREAWMTSHDVCVSERVAAERHVDELQRHVDWHAKYGNQRRSLIECP